MGSRDRGFKGMKRGLATGLFAIAALGAAVIGQSAQADALSEIEQRGTLRVAVPQDFPPFGSVGTDLQPRGYDIDMANYLADEMGVALELVSVTSANRVPFLQTRQVDLVISSLGKNPEREAMIDFSNAYAPFFLGVFGTSDSEPMGSAEALSGKTIGVTRGAVEDMELTEIAPDDTTIQRFEDNATTISAFLSGQVDYIATGNLVAAEIAGRNSQRAPALRYQLKDSPCYIGMNKQEPVLMAKVNELIAQALQDGTLEALSREWFHAGLPDNFGM
ncbi:transporter substrate-binding domain-containing protein [Litchfieldella rifensis]|uniref:Transporter substrate-binding domain-containing protein n=1 Tax=Litchfieldella rifensis TaxID=762643 RepID=A0ABV7LN18_9GAMM